MDGGMFCSICSDAYIQIQNTQGPAMTESMYQQIRISAADEVGEMEPKAVVAGKDTWLFVTVPEKPVAGEDVVVFFNRQQSEALRYGFWLLFWGCYLWWLHAYCLRGIAVLAMQWSCCHCSIAHAITMACSTPSCSVPLLFAITSIASNRIQCLKSHPVPQIASSASNRIHCLKSHPLPQIASKTNTALADVSSQPISTARARACCGTVPPTTGSWSQCQARWSS